MTHSEFTVCVFCGSRLGADPRYVEAARAVGSEIGRRGWGLVFGGGKVGLMGAVADAALAAGAKVTGIIPRSLLEREQGSAEVDELVVVESMHERKTLMADRADAFLALPGGPGTLEELAEQWTWVQLGFHAKPIGVLEVGGYWSPLRAQIEQMVSEGFAAPEVAGLLRCSDDLLQLLDGFAS